MAAGATRAAAQGVTDDGVGSGAVAGGLLTIYRCKKILI